MKKVQGLLAKVQRQGWLMRQEKSPVLGTVKWKRRYFVLQDNFLTCYKDDKAYHEARPDAIIHCEQCRIYELEHVMCHMCPNLSLGPPLLLLTDLVCVWCVCVCVWCMCRARGSIASNWIRASCSTTWRRRGWMR